MTTATNDPAAVPLTIDGRALAASPGTFLLQAAREAGIDIPTLCDHPDLEPVGACRLCLVEVQHPDWHGWAGLVTACLYPVAAGLEVSTHSPRVLRARRQVLTLLLARCPDAPLIRQLAAEAEVDTSLLHTGADHYRCILCGLCTRVCEAYATAAITTYGRGAAKAVGTFGQEPPATCVGCGACARVCPTGHLVGERLDGAFRIWDRTFATAVCQVATERCLGCGSCEEACPFRVARVSVARDGTRLASISSLDCRGCGACVGACPSGAILQPPHDFAAWWSQLLVRGEPS